MGCRCGRGGSCGMYKLHPCISWPDAYNEIVAEPLGDIRVPPDKYEPSTRERN